jgi:hypothetical protein
LQLQTVHAFSSEKSGRSTAQISATPNTTIACNFAMVFFFVDGTFAPPDTDSPDWDRKGDAAGNILLFVNFEADGLRRWGLGLFEILRSKPPRPCVRHTPAQPKRRVLIGQMERGADICAMPRPRRAKHRETDTPLSSIDWTQTGPMPQSPPVTHY